MPASLRKRGLGARPRDLLRNSNASDWRALRMSRPAGDTADAGNALPSRVHQKVNPGNIGPGPRKAFHNSKLDRRGAAEELCHPKWAILPQAKHSNWCSCGPRLKVPDAKFCGVSRLRQAYALAKEKNCARGVDAVTFDVMEEWGRVPPAGRS